MVRCAFVKMLITKLQNLPLSVAWSRLGEEIHQAIPQIQSLVWGQADIVSECYLSHAFKGFNSKQGVIDGD